MYCAVDPLGVMAVLENIGAAFVLVLPVLLVEEPVLLACVWIRLHVEPPARVT